MHELSYTRSIVDAVVTSAEDAGAHRVQSVYLIIGELRDIVDDLFRGCFEYLARGTIASGAKVVIDKVPLTLCCRRCGAMFRADALSSQAIACPCCAEQDYAVSSGTEFLIDRIEVA